MLIINFSKVKNNVAPLTHIERAVEMRSEFFKRSKALLIDAKNVYVVGDLFYDEPYVTGNFKVEADLVVPSSRSLKPVTYHESFTFVENYSLENPTRQEIDDNSEPIVKIEDDKIDLQTAIEDNILLNIPSTILTEEEKEKDIYPEGKGWEVISQATFDNGKKNQINPAFAKLKTLLNKNNDENNKK